MDLLQIHFQTVDIVQTEGLAVLHGEYPQHPLGAHIMCKAQSTWLHWASSSKLKQSAMRLLRQGEEWSSLHSYIQCFAWKIGFQWPNWTKQRKWAT